MERLTEKQKRFCEEYLTDLNAAQAAVRAGYSPKTADRIAYQNMQRECVREYIGLLRRKQSERTEITADKVLDELAAIAFSDRTEAVRINSKGELEFTPTDKLSDDVKKTVSRVKSGKFGAEMTSYDKLKALELIGKHLGIFGGKNEKDLPAEEIKIIDDIQ